MIKKVSINNLAVFQGFDWDKEVVDEQGTVCAFRAINVIYGRNYSGKTSLSRILRAMETGELSDKYQNPSFSVTFADGSMSDHNSLISHGKKIRVFNEDFVRDNLRFTINPDESIEP
ncbi:MAG TPA: AAA family ATPase, partial [Geobacteraceae bacterium]|nr:AAA family ATPase [Geobacteraceae bacterium]